MIISGIKLTIIGMGVVVGFLLLLVLVVNISFRFLGARSIRELAEIEALELKKKKRSIPAEEKNVFVAVISAAIAAHRRRAP